MSRNNLVRRGLTLIDPLRTREYEITLCPDCGTPAVAPPRYVEDLLHELFANPQAVRAALEVRPNSAAAWENSVAGDHDTDYSFGDAEGHLTLEERGNLRNLRDALQRRDEEVA